MESKVEPVEGQPCRRTLRLSVPSERVKEKFEQSWSELRSQVVLPGFRRGKAPRSLLVRRFGDDVAKDVKRDLVVEAIEDGVREHRLELVGDPDLDFEAIAFGEDQPIEFTVSVEVKPDFELPSYTGIKVRRTVEPVTEEAVASVMDDLRRRGSTLVPIEDGAVEATDHVVGVLVLERDGEEVFRQHGGAVIGGDESVAGVPMPGLENGLLGKESGATFTCDTEVPETFPIKDVAGQAVQATFTVEEIKRVEMPELNDELAADYGFDDLAAFREQIESDLAKRHEMIADRQVEDRIIDDILGRTDFPLPPTVVESTLRRRVRERMMEQLYAGRLDMDNLADADDALRAELLEETEHDLRGWYVIEKIAKKERLFATEGDVFRRIQEIAVERGATPTQVRDELMKKEQIDALRHEILEGKVRAFLAQNAEIQHTEPASAEAEAEATATEASQPKRGRKKKGTSDD